MGDFSKKIIFITILILLLGGISFYFAQRSKKNSFKIKGNMKIESPVFSNNQSIPPKYTCDGENINPPLKISNVPEEAKSLVLIVDDPDAPMGTWVHWTVWNISPQTKEIPEGAKLEGAVEGVTDFGSSGYGGPCPPSGKHRYFFKLYAIDRNLDLDSSAKKKDIEAAMEGHILEQAQLIGLYER